MTLRMIASAVIAALLLTGPALPPTQLPEGNSAPDATQATVLTAQEAEAAALKHAGFTATEAENLRSRYDGDERIPEWDVEFRVGDWEYDYAINAGTGAVLEWDKEYEPRNTVPPVTEPPVTEPPAQPQRLTREEVLEIALKKVKLTENQVKGLKVEFDWDDGIPEYEIEFIYDGWEYEFEIHAESGKILKWDKEFDD